MSYTCFKEIEDLLWRQMKQGLRPQPLDLGVRLLQRVFMVVALVHQVPQPLDLVGRVPQQVADARFD
jgi:hypothetical protein